jgi:hypothetical protein
MLLLIYFGLTHSDSALSLLSILFFLSLSWRKIKSACQVFLSFCLACPGSCLADKTFLDHMVVVKKEF